MFPGEANIYMTKEKKLNLEENLLTRKMLFSGTRKDGRQLNL